MFKSLLPALLVLASPVWATTSYYIGTGGETDFETDRIARGLTFGSVVDFAGQPVATALSDVGSTGVNFSIASGFIVTGGGTATFNDTATITLPANVYAIGFYLSRPVGVIPSTAFYSGGSFALPFGSEIFFGAMSDLPLASISPIVLTSTQGLTINRFFIGTQSSSGNDDEEEEPVITDPSAVPEPSTAALLGGSLVGLALMARRKRRAQDRPATAER